MRTAPFLPAAVALAVCLSSSPLPAHAAPKIAAPIGVVLYTDGAQVSQVSAQIGVSLFTGDTLSTSDTGSLHVRFGASQLVLGPATIVKLADATPGLAAVLQHGFVKFSVVGSPFELRVLKAIVRPREGAVGELVVVGPGEFQIASTRGQIDVNIGGVDRVVAESSAFDVTLEDTSTPGDGKRIHKTKGLWIPITIIAILTAVNLSSVTLSGHKF